MQKKSYQKNKGKQNNGFSNGLIYNQQPFYPNNGQNFGGANFMEANQKALDNNYDSNLNLIKGQMNQNTGKKLQKNSEEFNFGTKKDLSMFTMEEKNTEEENFSSFLYPEGELEKDQNFDKNEYQDWDCMEKEINDLLLDEKTEKQIVTNNTSKKLTELKNLQGVYKMFGIGKGEKKEESTPTKESTLPTPDSDEITLITKISK